MGNYITFGNWNKNYLYILGTSISLIFYRIITGYSYYTYENRLFDDDEYSTHFYINEFEYYVITLICSSLFLLYEKKRNKNEIQRLNHQLSLNNQDLIYNNIYEYENTNISNKFMFLNIFLYVFMNHIEIIYKIYFKNCDFWMIQLIVIAYLNMKMFKIKIYKHQFFALCTVSIPVIIKIATIILSFFDENNHFKDENHKNYKYDEDNTKNIKLLKPLYVAIFWISPLAIIFYIFVIISKSYALINIKKIMDLKYISITKVLIFFSLFGCIFTFILLIIFSFISCGEKNENVYDLCDYQFRVIYEKERYIENIMSYFKVEVWKYILISFFGGLAISGYRLFVFKVVQYLTPIHQGFSLPIFYFLEKISLIHNINLDPPMKYLNQTFFLDLSSDIAAIIGFLIFLEIIEFNFCELNRDLRKYIISRSKSESKHYVIGSESDNDNDESSMTGSESNDMNSLEVIT